MTMEPTPTICAIATGIGGAIGIIRVSGPRAIAITDSIFAGHSSLLTRQSHTVSYGTIVDNGEVIDEVLVSLFRAPHSYTGEDSTEISCHGSRYILNKVLSLLVDHGGVMAQPGEFTMRAFLHGRMNLSQAEAVADIIAAQTKAQHRIALSQLRGRYSAQLLSLREQLVTMCSLLELELDFSEEDVTFADRQQLLAIAQEIAATTAQLTASFRQGRAIREGVPVAIVGATNVGKSTLLNALVGDDRAIVSATPGTTRDSITELMTIDGILFRFIDTAGLRNTDDTIEQLGIDRTRQAITQAHVILLVTEPGVPYPAITVRDDQKVIRIVNKTDTFQAITGQGVDSLCTQLVSAVEPNDSDLLVTNQRHYTALCHAQQFINRVIDAINAGSSPELIAEDIHACLNSLAELLGTVATEDILHNIFAHFCIGK